MLRIAREIHREQVRVGKLIVHSGSPTNVIMTQVDVIGVVAEWKKPIECTTEKTIKVLVIHVVLIFAELTDPDAAKEGWKGGWWTSSRCESQPKHAASFLNARGGSLLTKSPLKNGAQSN